MVFIDLKKALRTVNCKENQRRAFKISYTVNLVNLK